MSSSLPERPELADDFVAASVDGRVRQASAIFGADPSIAGRSLLAATVLGDAEAVRERLAVDPAAAVAIDDERGWPPLLYACYSQWHHIDASRAAGLADVVRLLLDAGASPRTNDGGAALPFRTEGLGRGRQPRHHRGAARRRRQPRRRGVHRRSGPARALSLPRAAPLLRCPGGRHLGAWSRRVVRRSCCHDAASQRP